MSETLEKTGERPRGVPAGTIWPLPSQMNGYQIERFEDQTPDDDNWCKPHKRWLFKCPNIVWIVAVAILIATLLQGSYAGWK